MLQCTFILWISQGFQSCCTLSNIRTLYGLHKTLKSGRKLGNLLTKIYSNIKIGNMKNKFHLFICIIPCEQFSIKFRQLYLCIPLKTRNNPNNIQQNTNNVHNQPLLLKILLRVSRFGVAITSPPSLRLFQLLANRRGTELTLRGTELEFWNKMPNLGSMKSRDLRWGGIHSLLYVPI